MDLLTLGLESFQDARHPCVITCPPDHRKLQCGDKILVLRPWEHTPPGLKLGKTMHSLHNAVHNDVDGRESSGDDDNEGGDDNGNERQLPVNLDSNLDDLISSMEIDTKPAACLEKIDLL
jgi:hypothetical protein